MNKLTLQWTFNNIVEDKIERYCHNCSKKVVFIDSMKRRRNANGKTIYEYAIYKCEREHTWNRILKTYNAHTDINVFLEEEAKEIISNEMPKELLISRAIEEGIHEIEIFIEHINIKQRIDKLLGLNITDLSRTQIKRWIDSGKIQIDNCNVKPDTLVKNHQIIQIKLWQT